MGFCENAAIKENPLFQSQDSPLNNKNLFNSSILTNSEILMEGGKVGVSPQIVENSTETPCDNFIYEEEEITETFLSLLKLDHSFNVELDTRLNQIKDEVFIDKFSSHPSMDYVVYLECKRNVEICDDILERERNGIDGRIDDS